MRPRLPDASASRQLAALLLLRFKLPGTEKGKVAKEMISLLVEIQDTRQLEEALVRMEELDILPLLASLDDQTLNKLHRVTLPCGLQCRGRVDKELAKRLASQLDHDHLESLWHFLKGHLNDEEDEEDDSWTAAAACLLSTHMDRMGVDLSNLPLMVLREAVECLDDQDRAIAFAQDFFNYDLGISKA